MARDDDFNETVKRKVRERVGLLCSKPDCRVPTMAPSNNIGNAAHICAASKGGPRYDKSMTSQERKSIDNAIWLCATHATEIDRNPKKFPKELLYQWKKQAEDSATQELGIKRPSTSDTINTVSSALTALPTAYLPHAISNTHLATEKSLEKLDPRFSFITKYDDKLTTITCNAKEKISLSMKINSYDSKEYNTKLQRLIEHGKDLKIDSNVITIKGSKLFEEIINEKNSTFTMSTIKKPAIQKLWLIQDTTNIVESFDDIHGFISSGSKSFTFNGSTFNKMFNFTYQYSFDKKIQNNTVTMNLNMEQWNNLNIKSLPYFNKIFSLYSKMSQGWNLFTSLEINGEQLLKGNPIKMNTSNFITNMYSFLQYTHRCRIISNILQIDVTFISDIEYTAAEHTHISEISNILEGKEVLYKKDINSNPSLNIVVGENASENMNLFAKKNEPISIQLIQPLGDNVKLFETDIALPNKVVVFDSVIPIVHTNIDKIKSSDSIKIELNPQEDFKCLTSYKLN